MRAGHQVKNDGMKFQKVDTTFAHILLGTSPLAGIRPVCKIMSRQFDSVLYYFDIFHPWASPKKIMMQDGGDISLHTGAIPAGRLHGILMNLVIMTSNLLRMCGSRLFLFFLLILASSMG